MRTKVDVELLNKLISEGNSYIEVAKQLGCGKATVFKYLREENKLRKNIKNESEKKQKRRKSINVINWKKEKKKLLVEYKGGKCEKCEYNKCIEALEFHHLDPSKKDFTISSHSYSFERMKQEADKCILVCANCHREIHSSLK